jgi:hypothetical protein
VNRSSHAGGRRRLAVAVAVLAFWAGSGCDGVRFGGLGAPAPGDAEKEALDTLAARALPVPACGGAADLADVGSVFVVSIETAGEVTGNVARPQTERVIRLGVAAMCLDGPDALAQVLTCTLLRTPIEDPGGECAALVPGAGLLAALPVMPLRGGTDVTDPEQVLRLAGFDERWGLAFDAANLPEIAPVDPTTLPGVIDMDTDEEPGVTLHGDGEVPLEVFAVRQTAGVLALVPDGEGRLVGRTRTQTREYMIGGPAARATGERIHAVGEGTAVFVRADGLAGAPRVDADRDGRITCAEASRLYARLPALPTERCP